MAVLGHLAVEAGEDRDVLRVEIGLDPRAERAEGVHALGAGPLAVAALQVASRDVVGDRVAEDDLLGLLGLDVLAHPADDHRELALEADLGRQRRRDDDRVAGADDGRVGHEEHHRLGRELVAHLGGVVGVVAPDADDLAPRDHRREQSHLVDRRRPTGQLDPLVERVAGHLGDLLAVCVDEPVDGVVTFGVSRDAHGTTLVTI